MSGDTLKTQTRFFHQCGGARQRVSVQSVLDNLRIAKEQNLLPCPGDRRINEISCNQRLIVLCKSYKNSIVLAALRFMDRNSIGQGEGGKQILGGNRGRGLAPILKTDAVLCWCTGGRGWKWKAFRYLRCRQICRGNFELPEHGHHPGK